MSSFNHDLFKQMPIVGIMRNFPSEQIEKIVPQYIKAGLTTLEITMNSSNAEEMISHLVNTYPDMNIGAGTVCEISDLIKALDAGAKFIVTPILNREVIQYCVNNQIPVFPGAFSPSEIYTAWKLGATAVKIFPVAMFGPSYVKEIMGPLNKIKLLPTGGVTLDNIEQFFKNGAVGVGMGGTLFDNQLIAAEDYEGLYQHLLNYTKILRKILKDEETFLFQK